jgi:cytochrome P450 family 6
MLTHWTRQGVPQKDGTFLFGNVANIFTLKQSLGEIFDELYRKNKHHKIFGFYLSYRRALIINDPELIQDVLIRDFNSFHDRGLPTSEDADPISAHLFTLSGKKWRDLRVKLTPTLTSGKLKTMYPTIQNCAKVLEDYVDKNFKNGVDVFEFRDLSARFTINIISSVIFGVENDCINDQENIFRKMGYNVFKTSIENAVKDLMRMFTPELFIFFKLHAFNRSSEDFFFSLVRQTVEYREKNNYERNDVMQLLIKLKNQGYVSADKDERESEQNDENILKKLTINEVTAQAFIFFIAGEFDLV